MVSRNRIRPMLKPANRPVVRPPSVWDYIRLQAKMGDDTPYAPDDGSFLVFGLFTALGYFTEGGSITVAHLCTPDPAIPATEMGWKRIPCSGMMDHKVLELY